MESTESAAYTGVVTTDPKVQTFPFTFYMLPFKGQNSLQISALPPL